MKIGSYSHRGRDLVAAVTEHGVRDLTALVEDGPASFSPLRRLLLSPSGQELSSIALEHFPLIHESELEFRPLISDASKIIAAPINYSDHQAEMSQPGHIGALGFFLKAPSSVLAHGETVRLPYTDRRFDQEGELALVIARQARNVSVESALHYVAGYTCLLDITLRGGEDRSTRKSFDTFTPIGPYLVTPDEVGQLEDLAVRCWVDGTLRQDADISTLIWSVPQFVSYASSVMTLEPGDVLTTGTPAGVGRIQHGDKIEVTIDRIGTLSVDVSDEHAVACPTDGATHGPKPPETLTPVRQRS